MAAGVLPARAWGASIAVHVAAVLAFAIFLGAGHHHRHLDPPPAPARLVWIEPAPPASATGGSASLPAMADAPVVPVVPARHVEQAPKPTLPKPPALRKTGTARAVPAPRTAPVPAPRPEAADTTTEAAPSATDGVTGGIRGGVAGGLGDAPLALAAVARPPELLDRVVPEYPRRARALEVEGQVVLEVVLDRQGRPESDIRVLRSVPLLDAAAIAAVRQWRFRPARDAAGQAVRVVMEVPVRFVLR